MRQDVGAQIAPVREEFAAVRAAERAGARVRAEMTLQIVGIFHANRVRVFLCKKHIIIEHIWNIFAFALWAEMALQAIWSSILPHITRVK